MTMREEFESLLREQHQHSGGITLARNKDGTYKALAVNRAWAQHKSGFAAGREWLQHKPECPVTIDDNEAGYSCTCGLDDAIREMEGE